MTGESYTCPESLSGFDKWDRRDEVSIISEGKEAGSYCMKLILMENGNRKNPRGRLEGFMCERIIVFSEVWL